MCIYISIFMVKIPTMMVTQRVLVLSSGCHGIGMVNVIPNVRLFNCNMSIHAFLDEMSEGYAYCICCTGSADRYLASRRSLSHDKEETVRPS